jgi:uncharacterized Zn-binding protein involved in type VI secretion
MSKDSVARVGKDIGSNKIFKTGSTNVSVNDTDVVFETSTNSSGVLVIAGSQTVFVNDKGIGRETDGMSDGGLITSGSTNVFAGK